MSRWLHRVALLAPVAGVAALLVLAFGLAKRMNAWSARAFVMPFLVAFVCALASWAALLWLRRDDSAPPLRPWVEDLRGALSIVVAAVALWAWAPFVTRPFVGWLLRMVAAFRFH